jgi:hypothetical protein
MFLFKSPAKGSHPFVTVAVAGTFTIETYAVSNNMNMRLLRVFMQDSDILIIREAKFFGTLLSYFN